MPEYRLFFCPSVKSIKRYVCLYSSPFRFQLHGITRGNVIKICKENGIPVEERDFSVTEVEDYIEL